MKKQSIDQEIQRAVGLFRAGRVDEAVNMLLHIHKDVRDNFDVVSLLGNIFGRIGRFNEALDYFDLALEINPKSAEIWYYRGVALQKLDRHADAIHSFDEALVEHPNFMEALHDKGISLRVLKRPLDALVCMNRVLVLKPDSFQVYYNRALIFGELKKFNEEIRDYDSALRIKPQFVEALINSAVALGLMGRYEEGLNRVKQLISENPKNIEALFVRGEILCKLKDFSAALLDYQAVLAINPEHAAAISGLASLYAAVKRHDLAIQNFEKLAVVAPDFPYALGRFVNSKMMCAEWSSFDKDIAKIIVDLDSGSKCIAPFILLGLIDEAKAHRSAAEILVEDAYQMSEELLTNGEVYKHEKIKLAYVSADFHEHATSMLMAGLFEWHDKSKYELIAISYGPDDGSAMRKRIENGFSKFIDVSEKSDEAVAELMRSLEIDVAVDLKGHTADTRLGIFARRPAPIQVSYLGYPGTTAAAYIDYLIADKCVIPEESQEFYTEKIVYLPHTYQVNDDRREISSAHFSRADCGLPPEVFVFGSFNNSYKITPATFDIWMSLLRQLPESVLWLLGSSDTQENNIKMEAIKRGIAPERIIFAPRLKPAEHLRRLQLCDLYLDNFPYNAHTSASDALWAGVPVLTLQGTAFAGRVASSLLHAIGLPELVCTSPEKYESLAIEFAGSPEKLAIFRTRLAKNRMDFPLFDTKKFTKNIEQAFQKMVEMHTMGIPPEGFSVLDAYIA